MGGFSFDEFDKIAKESLHDFITKQVEEMMRYDLWKTDAPADGDFGDVNDFGEVEVSGTDEFGRELEYFDENPGDDPFHQMSDLEYRDEVTAKLLEAMDEFLSFSTARELMKLIGENL